VVVPSRPQSDDRSPRRGRSVGARVRKHEHKEEPKRDRRHDEEVGGDDLAGVIGEEGPPRLRRWSSRVGCAKLRSGREGVLVKQSAESIAAVDLTDGGRCARDRWPSRDGRDEA